jgi:hypothetical protein
MNLPQRIVLIIAAITIALMVLFPPWTRNNGLSVGYHFITNPPTWAFAVIDFKRLLVQFLATVTIAGILYGVTGSSKK